MFQLVCVLLLLLQSGKVTALVDGAAVASEVSAPAGTGYVGFGTGGFYAADFDDFNLKSGKNSHTLILIMMHLV